jgi:hypothetical protein
MPQDEELEALVRARRAAPDDASLVLRHARALARAGDDEGAERDLVAALDDAPGEPELTAALDRLNGGRARGAPWPSSAGDARRTRRSCAAGPTRGHVVLRRELFFESPVVHSFVVSASGKAYALTPSGLYEVDREGDSKQVAGAVRELGLEDTVLLPSGRILLVGRSNAVALLPRPRGGFERVPHRFSYSSKFAVGASGYLYASSRQGRVDAYRLSVPSEARTICRTEHDKTGLAIAPGGDLVVAIEGSQRKNRPARLVRLDPRGAVRFELVLKERSFGKSLSGPVVGADGTVYMGFPGEEVFARDKDGGRVFEVPYVGEPVALAGEQGEILVTREERSLHFLDARTGAVRASWGSAFFQGPIVDAKGWVYVRRGDDLVAFDPSRPSERPAFEVKDVAPRAWDFVLAGEGRIFAFPRLGSAAQFVVIE